MSPDKTLYISVIGISEDFLGPAGERFMRRQIRTHLSIQPERLQKKHLPELVEWVRLACAVLTNDPEQVSEFAQRILNLSKPSNSAVSMKARNDSTS